MPGGTTATTAQALDVWTELGTIGTFVGLAVSLAGFYLSFKLIRESKSAAEQAQQSAEKARRDILRTSTMADLSAATAAIAEIKRLHREANWPASLERYSALRTVLISIRSSMPELEEAHRTIIQGVIAQMRTLEGKVERAAEEGQLLSPARLNEIVSDQLDKLSEVLGALRSGKNG